MISRFKREWGSFAAKHPAIAQFLIFFILSNAITVFQFILMPLLKGLFGMTTLVDTNFQIGRIGSNADGSPFYIFRYAAGPLPDGGGGLAYFLAVQLTLAVAQVINFFAQRNITFKASGSIVKAALWYVAAYIAITVGAAALQGFYKAPVYNLMINTWELGGLGETLADIATMLINSIISFWVFFPIFKFIFKNTP